MATAEAEVDTVPEVVTTRTRAAAAAAAVMAAVVSPVTTRKNKNRPISRFRSVDVDRLSRSRRPDIPRSLITRSLNSSRVYLDRDPSERGARHCQHTRRGTCSVIDF